MSQHLRRQPSLALIRHQAPMLSAWGRVYALSVFPFLRPQQNPSAFLPLTALVPPPDPDLVRAYAGWTGADARHHIPAHMFCQWGLPLAIRVIEQSRYDVREIINQGLHLRVHGELPYGETLIARAEMLSVEEDAVRASLAIKVTTGTRRQPVLQEAVLYSTFILGAGRSRVARNWNLRAAGEWSAAGNWSAGADDGFHFAVLTGDFNPIHWLERAGRKSPFGSRVLQGFAAFARSYECLRARHDIREIEVLFQRPVLLPSGRLEVERAPAEEGWQLLRLRDGDDRTRLSGRFR